MIVNRSQEPDTHLSCSFFTRSLFLWLSPFSNLAHSLCFQATNSGTAHSALNVSIILSNVDISTNFVSSSTAYTWKSTHQGANNPLPPEKKQRKNIICCDRPWWHQCRWIERRPGSGLTPSGLTHRRGCHRRCSSLPAPRKYNRIYWHTKNNRKINQSHSLSTKERKGTWLIIVLIILTISKKVACFKVAYVHA